MSGLSGRRAPPHSPGWHASYWCDWRPWLAVLGLAAPLGFLLSHAARWWADSSAIYLVMYIDGWTSGYLASPGARRDLFVEMTTVLVHSVTLVGWSWTGGAVLSSLSRRVLGLTATLFVAVVLAGTAGTITTARAFGGNAGVFAVPFYGFVLPWLFKTALVLLPAWLRMRRGLRPVPLQLPPAILVATAVTSLTLWTGRGLQASLIFGRGTMPNPGLDGNYRNRGRRVAAALAPPPGDVACHLPRAPDWAPVVENPAHCSGSSSQTLNLRPFSFVKNVEPVQSLYRERT
jgi:hypothetical protein